MGIEGKRRPAATWPARSLRLVLAAISGSMLFLSDHPTHWWPLQLCALVPWLWALTATQTDGAKRLWGWAMPASAGFLLGLFYAVPLLVVTAFPWMMAVGLGLYTAATWTALSIVLARLLAWPGLRAALAVGAAAAFVEWLAMHAVPVWGTAQSFVRVWSEAPWAIQFVEVTGTTGIVFVLFTLQVLIVRIVRGMPNVRHHAAALGVLVGIVAVYDTVRWLETPRGTMRVAAVGWTDKQLPQGTRTSSPVIVRDMLVPLVHRAVDQGATLVVSPEAPFNVAATARDALLQPLFELARTRDVAIAVGYFDTTHDDNRVVFIDRQGARPTTYRKSHLIPLIERYEPGDGTRVSWDAHGHGVGAMVCQDDNFMDLASGYGRDGLPIVVVPTNDWHAVKNYHFENSRMRPLENRYGIVRAATNGVSAIVSARGEVLAATDHFEDGAGAVVADLPLFRPGSAHAWARHAFPLGCAVLLLGLGWSVRRARLRGAV
jgi:apolipoprotein N-acyltransferase